MKKIVITRIGGQDDGFVFSPDGRRLFNIERPCKTTRTQLTEYCTSDFSVVKTLFADRKDLVLQDIEFDLETGDCYVLGFMCNEEGIIDYGFTGQLVDDEIIPMKRFEIDDFMYIGNHKYWESTGFTDKSLECSGLKRDTVKREQMCLKDVCGTKWVLSDE